MNRIVWVDNLKFLAMFLVIWGHTMHPLGDGETLRNIIYAVHMPLFFFISGFLYRKKTLMQDICSLILPYFIYQGISVLILLKGDLSNLYFPIDKIQKCFIGILLGNGYDTVFSIMPNVPLWFLIALFWVKRMMNLLSTLNGYSRIIVSFVLSMLPFYLNKMGIDIWFSIDSSMQALFWVALGNWYKENPSMQIKKENWLIFIIVVIAFGMGAFCNGRSSINMNLYGNNLLLYYVVALCGIVSFVYISQFLTKLKFIETISDGTLLILGLHLFAINFLLNYINGFESTIIVLLLFYYPIVFCSKKCCFLLGKYKI